MKNNQKYLIRVLLTGLICGILLSSVLFAARSFCRYGMGLAQDNSRNSFAASFSLATDILGIHQNDPNIIYRSNISAYYQRGALLGPEMGLNRLNQFNFVPIYTQLEKRYNNYDRFVFLDTNHKLLVHCYGYAGSNLLSNARMQDFIAYIGPQGFSTTPDKNLGQFDRLIAVSYWNTQLERDLLLVYDSRQKCFLRIDLENQTIETGPPLPPEINAIPLQIKNITRRNFAQISWGLPQYTKIIPFQNYENIELDKDIVTAISRQFPQKDPNALPVLTDDGAIYKLDIKTLEITDFMGRLAHSDSQYYLADPIRPDQLLDWQVTPLFFKNEYRGLATAAFDRSADKMTLAVFDSQGRYLLADVDRIHRLLNNLGFGPLSKLGKYLVETLHPPLMTVASYFTSNAFDVDDSFHTLFFIPNSYAAIGLNEPGILSNFILFIVLLVPALIVAVCFASLIARDASSRGLPKPIVRYWIVAAFAFGFTAYLTYRFTRPDITLINCPNCGKNRRPDQSYCHRCDAPWSLPQLSAPTWRVIDS